MRNFNQGGAQRPRLLVAQHRFRQTCSPGISISARRRKVKPFVRNRKCGSESTYSQLQAHTKIFNKLPKLAEIWTFYCSARMTQVDTLFQISGHRRKSKTNLQKIGDMPKPAFSQLQAGENPVSIRPFYKI